MGWDITQDLAGADGAMDGFLRSRPVEHTVLLTVLEALRARGADAYGDGPARLGCWRDAGCVAGAFVHTPPFPALLSDMPPEAARELTEALVAAGGSLPGITARRETAEIFARSWCARTGAGMRVGEQRRLYRFGAARPPATRGHARPARRDDRGLLLSWYGAAEREIGVRPGDHGAAIDHRIGYGGLTLWEVGGVPVALAGRSPMIAGMVRVAPVYTPPQHRGHGYGGAVAVAVSQAATAAGAADVVIFSDPADPVRASICRRIGFRPFDDYLVVCFTPGRRPAVAGARHGG